MQLIPFEGWAEMVIKSGNQTFFWSGLKDKLSFSQICKMQVLFPVIDLFTKAKKNDIPLMFNTHNYNQISASEALTFVLRIIEIVC